MIQAEERFVKFKQGNLSNAQFLEKFKDLFQQYAYLGGEPGANTSRILKFISATTLPTQHKAAMNDAREKAMNNKVVFVRIEQLYPFPAKTLANVLKRYSKAKFIWCQEEPTNQGAWYNHRHRLQEVIDRLNLKTEIGLVSREASSAPAVGLNKLHIQQQEALVIEALTNEK